MLLRGTMNMFGLGNGSNDNMNFKFFQVPWWELICDNQFWTAQILHLISDS